VGAHSTGRKVWALGRWHRLNQTLEALFVAALIAAAAFAGWVSTVPPRPLGSVLNHPVVAGVPSRPTDPPVPPVSAALLGHDTAAPEPPPPKRPSTTRKKVSTTNQGAPRPTSPS
jgi:hypothetical protein